ncbi:MAG: Gx transporter family protein [Butyricicoccaceae bacterium]
MWALLHVEGKFCSLLGVSVAGAAAHNIGQIAAAVLWMKTTAVLAYLPYLLLIERSAWPCRPASCAGRADAHRKLIFMHKILFFLPHYHKNRGGKRYENIDTAIAAVRLQPSAAATQRTRRTRTRSRIRPTTMPAPTLLTRTRTFRLRET